MLLLAISVTNMKNELDFNILQSMKNVFFHKFKKLSKYIKNLHVKLQFCGNSIPLPQWFVKGKTAKMSMTI